MPKTKTSSVIHFKTEFVYDYKVIPTLLCGRHHRLDTVMRTTEDETKVTCGLCILSLKGL